MTDKPNAERGLSDVYSSLDEVLFLAREPSIEDVGPKEVIDAVVAFVAECKQRQELVAEIHRRTTLVSAACKSGSKYDLLLETATARLNESDEGRETARVLATGRGIESVTRLRAFWLAIKRQMRIGSVPVNCQPTVCDLQQECAQIGEGANAVEADGCMDLWEIAEGGPVRELIFAPLSRQHYYHTLCRLQAAVASIAEWGQQHGFAFTPEPACATTQAPENTSPNKPGPGGGFERTVGALNLHHKYHNGVCENRTPATMRDLTALVGGSTSTMSEHVTKIFGTNAGYRNACRDGGKLDQKLKQANQEYAPTATYGRCPPGEGPSLSPDADWAG